MTPVGVNELVFFALAFTLLFLLGRGAAYRWLGPVIAVAGALPQGDLGAGLRRRALLVPAFLALLSFSGWVAAALVWGVLWPLLAGTFTPAGAMRQSSGTRILVSGATRALLKDERDLTSLPAVRVKGRVAEVEVFSLA